MKKLVWVLCFIGVVGIAANYSDLPVAGLAGVTVSTTPPVLNQCLVATSSSAAGWGSCSSGSGIGGTWGATTGNVVTTNGANSAQDSGTVLTALAPKASPTFTGTVTTALGAGVVRSNSSGVLSSAELSGDVTTSASNAATVAKIQSTTVSGTTGTGNVVFSAAPTFTGTSTFATITAASATLTASTLTSPVITTPTGFFEVFTGHLEAPTDKTFVLDQSAAYAYTINTLKIATVSGTTTAAVKINGTSVTGISAVSVSSTPATGTATAANSVAIGDKVTLVLSSSSTPVDMSFTLKYTR